MARHPNLLLIALDSLRADHMSLYGYGRLTTPHMDRIARGGVVFENAFSPHIPTTPAFAGMLTEEHGRICCTFGAVEFIETNRQRPFFLMLRYMDPHSVYLPPAPFDRMFYGGDEFDPANKSMEPVWVFKPFRDYFATWMPPGLTDREYVIAQYDGAVAYMDAWVGGMLAQVSALGLDDDTLVIIVADHGEALNEHGCSTTMGSTTLPCTCRCSSACRGECRAGCGCRTRACCRTSCR